MRYGWLVLALALLPGLRCLAAEAPAAQSIEMKLVELSAPAYMSMMDLPNGPGEIDFPNKFSKLKIQYNNGQLALDSNGDGKIDASDTVLKKGGKVMVAALVGGREVQLPIFIYYPPPPSKFKKMVLGVGGDLEGTFKGARVQMGWNELSAVAASAFSVIKIGTTTNSLIKPLNPPRVRTVAVAGELYTFEVLQSGWEVRFTPYSGPAARAKVQVEGTTANEGSVFLQSADGSQTEQVMIGETAALSPGQYRFATIHLAVKEAGKERPTSWASGQSPRDKFIELPAGESVIKFGGPFKLEFAASRDASAIHVTRVDISGIAGELYTPKVVAQGSNHTFAVFIRGGGKERELCKLSYG